MDAYNKDFDCCPPFDPIPWDDKLHTWDNKLFIKDKVFTFYFMPLNFSAVMRRLNKLVERSSAEVPQWLRLSDHTSKWNMDLYMAVDREIHGAENVSISGKFYSRVYEGDFRQTDVWCRDVEKHAAKKGLNIEKLYIWYTTCPKCAKKYGKNYVVIIVKLK